jgi:beta-glucanase (GH16 family)
MPKPLRPLSGLFAAAIFAMGTVAFHGLQRMEGGTIDSTTRPATNPSGRQWKLVWSDEFDYQGLPDPKKWDYEEGFIRNGESQYYTRDRLENARVENGMLIIEGRKEDYADPHPRAGATTRPIAHYTAASLITLKKADWLYGRIEVRAKLPQGKGVWPAIWMLGSDIGTVGWPACGEIDIVEFVGKIPDRIHGTVHYQKDGKHASSGKALPATRPFDDFHIYAVEWAPDRIDFFFDDRIYHSFPVEQANNKGANPFHKNQFLLINLALGGAWGGKIDDTILPQQYLVKYVRVYKAPEVGD